MRPQEAREARQKPLAEISGDPLENTQEYRDKNHPEVTGSLVEPLVFKTAGGTAQTIPPPSTCENTQAELCAFLGALAENMAPTAPDLAAILAAWPDLPEPVRAGILAMVKATSKREPGRERSPGG